MIKHYHQVKDFHKACGIEMPNTPTMLSGASHPIIDTRLLSDAHEDIKLDAKFLNGENEVMNRSSYFLEEIIEFMQAKTIEDQADALTDLLYFTIGTFTLMGINPEPIFDIVAKANLGKIQPDGTVLRDPQGKIMKPEGWKEKYAPEAKIKYELETQGIYNDYKNHK